MLRFVGFVLLSSALVCTIYLSRLSPLPPMDIDQVHKALVPLYIAQHAKACGQCNEIGDGKNEASLLARKGCELRYCNDLFSTTFPEKESLSYYTRAAALGSPEANYFLGRYYRETAEHSSFEYYKRAAKLGHAKSQATYAGLLFATQKADMDTTIHWFEKSIANKDIEASTLYGAFLYMMSFQNEDMSMREKGKKLFSYAARHGSHNAQMGIIIGGEPSDFEADYQWFINEAESGNHKAYLAAGYLYEAGVSVPKDLNIAKKWFEKSLRAGNHWGGIALINIFEAEAKGD